MNKEAHKLHKVNLAPWNVELNPELGKVLEEENVKTWQTNPYRKPVATAAPYV